MKKIKYLITEALAFITFGLFVVVMIPIWFVINRKGGDNK